MGACLSDAWGGSWGTSWGSSWNPAGPTPSNIPMGGAGHPTVYWGVRKHKKFTKNLDWLLDRVVSEYYGELTESDVPMAVQKEAAKIVRPYAKDGDKIPQSVNWAALEQDFDRVIKLLELYQQQQDDEDMLWMMMH